MRDSVAWRARGYFLVKLPLATVAWPSVAACWLGGLFCVTFPAWQALGLGTASSLARPRSPSCHSASSLLLIAPWATHGLTQADRWLMRSLLGPGLPRQR